MSAKGELRKLMFAVSCQNRKHLGAHSLTASFLALGPVTFTQPKQVTCVQTLQGGGRRTASVASILPSWPPPRTPTTAVLGRPTSLQHKPRI